jgi:hypothetical protein
VGKIIATHTTAGSKPESASRSCYHPAALRALLAVEDLPRTPIAFGNWRQAYTVVNRKAVIMLVDPYSAGFCTIFKFEARVGGATNAPERGVVFTDQIKR